MKNLSAMEDTILNYYADGMYCKQISEELGISTRTTETYRERILLKLNANHITHAVAIYARLGKLQ